MELEADRAHLGYLCDLRDPILLPSLYPGSDGTRVLLILGVPFRGLPFEHDRVGKLRDAFLMLPFRVIRESLRNISNVGGKLNVSTGLSTESRRRNFL